MPPKLILRRVSTYAVSLLLFNFLAFAGIFAQQATPNTGQEKRSGVLPGTAEIPEDTFPEDELPGRFTEDGLPNILIVGGGSSHDYDRWFNLEDSKTIAETGAMVRYTDQPKNIPAVLSELDILYLSNNQPLPEEENFRSSLFRFVESGNGLLLVHAPVWYNWEDWPEYNRLLVGGGSRSHGAYGEFEVQVTESGHPVTDGVPHSFRIKDELYRFEMDDEGSEIEVLAMGIEPDTGNRYPVVWTLGYGDGRIVCITLGHDGESHNHQAYKKLIRNSINWLSQSQDSNE